MQMKSRMKNLLSIFTFMGISLISQADLKQTGVYLSAESLAVKKAEQEGLGTQLKTFGVDFYKTTALTPSIDRYFSLGFGLTGGDDKDSFGQGVQQGSGGAVFHKKSSIFGASIFGDIGVSKSLNAKTMAFAGIGSSYYYLNREVSDCSGCKAEKINLAFAPYAKLGMNFCGERSCLDISYRYFMMEEYVQGIGISWRTLR